MSQILPQISVAVLSIMAMSGVGYLFDHYGPYSIWAVLLIIGVMLFIASVCMQIFAYMHGDRFAVTAAEHDH